MSARTNSNSWMKALLVAMLTMAIAPLSGPLFYCECADAVVPLAQLKTQEECCEIHCDDEVAASESSDCPDNPSSPCDEEFDLFFVNSAPEGFRADAPLPLDITSPGGLEPDLGQFTLVEFRAHFATVIPPPELAVAWQFVFRAALPARAPSLAS